MVTFKGNLYRSSNFRFHVLLYFTHWDRSHIESEAKCYSNTHKINGPTSNYSRAAWEVSNWESEIQLFHRGARFSSTLPEFFIESMNSPFDATRMDQWTPTSTTRLRKLFASLTFRKQRSGTSKGTNYTEFFVWSIRIDFQTLFNIWIRMKKKLCWILSFYNFNNYTRCKTDVGAENGWIFYPIMNNPIINGLDVLRNSTSRE